VHACKRSSSEAGKQISKASVSIWSYFVGAAACLPLLHHYVDKEVPVPKGVDHTAIVQSVLHLLDDISVALRSLKELFPKKVAVHHGSFHPACEQRTLGCKTLTYVDLLLSSSKFSEHETCTSRFRACETCNAGKNFVKKVITLVCNYVTF
jgi:hypothetical protein